MAQLNTITLHDLYKAWDNGEILHPDADKVYFWHNDSEVVSLDLVGVRDIKVTYADRTYDIVSRYETVIIQPVMWHVEDIQ